MEVETIEMTLGERLKNLRENLKKSDKQWTMDFVAKKVGVTKGAVSQYENDENKPSHEVLKSLASLYKVSIDGLINNENQYVGLAKDAAAHAPRTEKTKLFLSELPDKDAELYVPYYDVEITAGKIELFFDDVEEVPQGYVYAPQYHGCVMCNVKGNSMYDLIYPGARLYVYRMPDCKYIDFGQIYLIVLNNNLRVLKYIRRHASDDTKIILASHNKDHDSWDVEKADILNLFMVKGFENQTAM